MEGESISGASLYQAFNLGVIAYNRALQWQDNLVSARL